MSPRVRWLLGVGIFGVAIYYFAQEIIAQFTGPPVEDWKGPVTTVMFAVALLLLEKRG